VQSYILHRTKSGEELNLNILNTEEYSLRELTDVSEEDTASIFRIEE
jgi:hypothetical protein